MSIYEAKCFKAKREAIKDDVIKSYKEHYSLNKVAKIFDIHSKTVARILKENNIDYKGRGYASQKVKINPFDNKTVEDKSYWLGFIAGDGYINQNKNQIVITSIDLEIINNYKLFIGEGLNIQTFYKNNKPLYVATFSHLEAKDYLVKRGITSNKSKTLKFNVKLNWNIIRGLFDADGSFSQNRLKITTGSNKTIEQLILFFKEYNIDCKIQDKGKQTCWDVYLLGGKDTIEKVYNYFYNHNPTYFLTRKKEQIRRYIE
jgi:intein-encoded DNA endonuclease-like protein